MRIKYVENVPENVAELYMNAYQNGVSVIAICEYGKMVSLPRVERTRKQLISENAELSSIKMIFGVKMHVTDEDNVSPQEAMLFAMNQKGLRNLYYLFSHAEFNLSDNKVILDWEQYSEYTEDVELLWEDERNALWSENFEEVKIISDEVAMPELSNAYKTVEEQCEKRLHEIFGEAVPIAVTIRLTVELNYLKRGTTATDFLIAYHIATDANEQGYNINTRGCVGASLISYLLGITDFYPLEQTIPDKELYAFSLPLETLFESGYDTGVDIDINISSGYIQRAVAVLHSLFGEGNVIQASSRGMEDGKCYTYPGGYVVIPDNFDIYQYSPTRVIYDDKGEKTTVLEFDYYCLDHRLRKYDIYEVDFLNDMQGQKNTKCQMPTLGEMCLWSEEKQQEFLKQIEDEYTQWEFGNLEELLSYRKPKSIEELVDFVGLAFGTEHENGRLVEELSADAEILSQFVAYRDDVYNELVGHGLPRSFANVVMTEVRKGKGIKTEWVDVLLKCGIQQLFVDRCNQWCYLFPKAH